MSVSSNKFSKIIPAPIYHIGEVKFISFTTIPDGWMEADGSAISRVTYKELFAKIGTTYGAGDGSTTFNIPDLRGEFIRGWDHGRGTDLGRTLGSWQTDLLKNHTHSLQFGGELESMAGNPSGWGGVPVGVVGNTGNIIGGQTNAETRPRNVALMAIIKVKNIAGSDAEVIGANADTVDGLHANDFLIMLAGNNTSPIGSISMVPYGTPDAGWLECNGQAVLRTTYWELFNKIGTTFGSGDGSTTFNIPDLRGEFIRGWDHGRGVDSGRNLGTLELDAFQGHHHHLSAWSIQGATTSGGTNYYPSANHSYDNWDNDNNFVSNPVSDGTNGTPRTAAETRPRNIALMFVIKAKAIAGTDPTIINQNADTVDGLHASDFLLRSQPLTSFKNLLINGNFDFWQRGTSLSNAVQYKYLADRWANISVGSTIAVSQQLFVLGQGIVPNEPTYFHRTIVTSVAGASNVAAVQQKIESIRTLAGKTATLSFWAKADSAKNIAIDFQQTFGTGGSASATVSGIGSTKVPLTTDWQKYTITINVPSISGKIIGTDKNDCLVLNFMFDAGSSLDSRTLSLGQQSGTFDIAQVQLEEGSVATSFELRPYQVELTLCQRYYQILTIGAEGSAYISGSYGGSNFNFIVPMRLTPTATLLSAGQSGYLQSGWPTLSINLTGGFYEIKASQVTGSFYAIGYTYGFDAEL